MLDALGPEIAAWPQDAASAAVELLASSEAAQDLFATSVAVAPPTPGKDAGPLAERVGEMISRERKA